MASRGQSLTLTYVAWDTNANAGKTGDVSNHTLRWVKDGASAAPANSPSEVDATNAPGVYKLTLTASECTCDAGVLCGKSSTANVALIPVTVTFEQLPAASPGANGGVPTVDAANRIAGIQGTVNDLNNLDASVASRLASVGYTAPDNSGIAAIKTKTDNLPADPASNTQVNTRLAASGYTAPDNAGIAAAKAVTDKLDTTLEPDGAIYRFTDNALEQAGPADWADAERQQIRKALGVTGSTAETSGAGNLDAVLSRLVGMPVIVQPAVVATGQDLVRYRGDTVPLSFRLGRDITGAALAFTVKQWATDPQSAALIEKSSAQAEEIEVTDPEEGGFVVKLVAGDTSGLLPDGRRASFLYDVELSLDGVVETIFAGALLLLPDVTTE